MAGLTLIELILACGILLILSSAAIPLARVTIIRNRESELHRDLREMRTAIDRYKDAADKNQIQTEVGSQGYPPDLQTLVDGVTVSTTGVTGGISASALAGASSTGQFGSVGTTGSGFKLDYRGDYRHGGRNFAKHIVVQFGESGAVNHLE